MKIKFLLITAVLTTAIFFSAGSVKAIDNSDLIAQLQAQIQSLMQQIQQLIAQQQGGQAWCHAFNKNLYYGYKGEEVVALHTALDKEGITYGDDANDTYDEGTSSAIVEFQEKYASDILAPIKLKHGTGNFGPTTRKKMNALYSCRDKKECVIDSDCPQLKCASGDSKCLGSAYKCVDGKCVTKPTPQCATDRDCPQGSCAINADGTPNCPSPLRCANGKCVETCTESDNGKDYYTKGTVTWLATGNIATDSCDSSTVLNEYQCQSATSSAIFPVKYTCPNGCENGACKQATTYCSQWHAKFMASYQKSCGETGYDPVADVDKDKTVGLTDVGFYAANQTNETWCQQKLSETTSPCAIVQPSITVTSPNGGETWTQGSFQKITWTSGQYSANSYSGVNINLYSADCWGRDLACVRASKKTIASSSSDPNSYLWQVGAYESNNLIVPGNYYIEVCTDNTDKAACDSSDNYFSIVAPTATCTDSDGGLNPYIYGSTYVKSGFFELKHPDECALVSNYDNNGKPGGWQGTNSCSGKDCYIQEAYCRTDENGNVIDADADELINCPNGCENGACKQATTQPSITVLSPNGGETWNIGETHNITWNSSGLLANSYVTVSVADYSNGVMGYPIAQVLASQGTYSWNVATMIPVGTVGSTSVQNIVPGNNFKVQVVYNAAASGYAEDISNNYFSIVAPATTYCSQWHAKFMASYQKSCGETGYDPVADVDKDKTVGLTDVGFYAANQTNEAWCQQKLSETTSPCATSLNTNDSSLASISDAIARIIQGIQELLKK